ncbi:FecR family protein [Pseudobacter ginsenosidimutans]|uniref:FecR family protein n=2 Tax=Pseudobacter ginsenosidimutans TaxID=661488 RepID=A0A4V2F169_9BACT|nr:FecR family protein [Pseudobacter ginsenosidimutans]RZS72591.1 FecR family protein [Pseudobacter ginsenosidimutans]
MNEISKTIADLIRKHLNDELNDQEKQELDNWVQQSEEHRLFFEQLTHEETLAATISEYETSRKIIFEKIKKAIPLSGETEIKSAGIRRLNPGRLTAIAASILVIGGVLVWWSVDRKDNRIAETTARPVIQQDLQPASEGAILKLADGKEIILDETKDGAIAQEGNTQITKSEGLLSYNGTDPSAKVLYNTLSTPKGRIYKLSLPDGSRVWLNAASSIRFPTAFTGNERNVEISGEVYFEIRKDVEKPFLVKVDHQTTIEVLGTEFNVNAYQNEKILRTTLLTGAIRMQSQDQPGTSVVLKPGQQAQWKNIPAIQPFTVVQQVNIEKVMGWKNGYFSFDDLTLEELMREVERWYDVEVLYENGVPSKSFFGKVNRNLSLLDFMEGMKDWGVRLRLEGRKLIVTGVD